MSFGDRLGGIFGGAADAPAAADAAEPDGPNVPSDAPPVGRERELGQLLDAVDAAAARAGRLVLVEGHVGYGKSSLLVETCRRARARGGEGAPEIVLVGCYETGTEIPLSAFGDVVSELTREDGPNRRISAQKVIGLIGDASPLLQFVPGVGPPLAVAVKAVSSVAAKSLEPAARGEQPERSRLVVELLRRVARDQAPLVILVDDAQWLDAHSADVVLRLLRDLPTIPLTLALAYDVDGLDEEAPLDAVLSEAARSQAAVKVTLPPFGVEDVRRLLVERFGGEPHPNLAPWLTDAVEGNPALVDSYLHALRDGGAVLAENGSVSLDGAIEGETGSWSVSGRIAELPRPANVEEVLGRRVERLDDEERRLLQTGAVQGRRFLTAVLGRLVGEDEFAVADKLRTIYERRRVIAFDSSDDWWTRVTDVCAFAPGTLRELLYDRVKVSPSDLRRRHRAIAEALEALVAERQDEPPRRVRVDIADHLARGGEPIEAARRFVDIAEATYAEGGIREAQAQAERALGLVRDAQGEESVDDVLVARTLSVLLVVSEPHWAGEQRVAGTPLAELAAEAVAAAERAGEPGLRSEALYARALIAMAFGRLADAYSDLQAARELAREADDPLAEAAILVEYGHHLDQENLRAGRALVQEAWELVSGPTLEGRVPAKQLELVRAQVESAIGVAEFDLGNYGAAVERLETVGPRLREAKAAENAGWAFSFLAQVRTAIGLFDEAEEALGQGLAIFADETRPLAVRAFLSGLRGHLLLEREPRQLEEAEAALAQAAEEARAAGNLGIVPLVTCYRAEAALARGEEPALREVDHLLAEAVAHSDETGWKRGAIGGRALQARVALVLGDAQRALALSAGAVEELTRAGGEIPVFRSEEILFTRARIVQATGGDPAEPLAEARRQVDAKAASLTDPVLRDSYLARIRLTRAILSATGETLPPGR